MYVNAALSIIEETYQELDMAQIMDWDRYENVYRDEEYEQEGYAMEVEINEDGEVWTDSYMGV